MSRFLATLGACIGILAAGTTEAREPASDQDLAALAGRFQAGLDTICQKYQLPGMTAAYALPDGRVVAFASGLADKETAAKMTVDTRMPAGSIGKTFVAATIIGLAQDGKLSLDDKAEKWLGDEGWFGDLPNGREMTVRNLLMHRGGVADHIYDPDWIAAARQMVRNLDADPDYYFKPADLVQYILKRKPLFAPGAGFKYTDTGYILLGLIAERGGRQLLRSGARSFSHAARAQAHRAGRSSGHREPGVRISGGQEPVRPAGENHPRRQAAI